MKLKTCRLEAGGTVLHGSVVDGEHVIDEVVVGCEGDETFVIHCHGNPLLVERIIKLLQSHGAVLTDAEKFAAAQLRAKTKSTIEAEAKLAMQKSETLLGVKILQAQIDGGLSRWVNKCVDNFEKMTPQDIKDQCQEILERSEVAKRIIEGVRIVIAGPPNSGKSTLLNCLAGQQRAVVSDTAGTTRDWVSVTCQLGPIRAEFIDTAGLDEALAGSDAIEHAAQRMTKELLESCDVVLFVRDAAAVISSTTTPSPLRGTPPSQGESFREPPVICVCNKCDLLPEYPNTQTQNDRGICLSAAKNQGIDRLSDEIVKVLGVSGFGVTSPVVFTVRQRQLLTEILYTPAAAKASLEQLQL